MVLSIVGRTGKQHTASRSAAAACHKHWTRTRIDDLVVMFSGRVQHVVLVLCMFSKHYRIQTHNTHTRNNQAVRASLMYLWMCTGRVVCITSESPECPAPEGVFSTAEVLGSAGFCQSEVAEQRRFLPNRRFSPDCCSLRMLMSSFRKPQIHLAAQRVKMR